ncbi:uncharacterized protein LOC121730611 [Aricia agestis]|uniref:uncharacterized protein LOC121730611 n=1 Tax=Aricia agestis TaxID=91739 RepID=UPI001C20373C|nr:uncharacterized protein LOC121730611 [Aricia agestis]
MQGESDGDDASSYKSSSSKKRKIFDSPGDKYKPFQKPSYTRKYPDTTSNGEFVVFVEHCNKDTKIGNMNPLNLSKIFKNAKGVHERSRISARKIKIIFKQAALANDFLNAQFIQENNLRAYIPAASVERVGVVRYIPKEISNRELFEKISSDLDIIGVRRFMKKENNTFVPLNTITVTFSGTVLPQCIFLDGWRYKVHNYIPPVLQCFKCLLFNHSAKYCFNEQACSKCAENHSYKECTSEALKCKNCGGNHLAISKECPIKASKIKKNISLRVNNSTYADITNNLTSFPPLTKANPQNVKIVPEKISAQDIINNQKILEAIISTIVSIGNSNEIKTTTHIKETFIKNFNK